jgi:prevent-host-death family protein
MRNPKLPTWNLQDAAAKLSEVVDLAQAGKPQVILRRGTPAAAVVSMSDYQSMHPSKSLISFLLRSPLMHSELDLSHAEKAHEMRADLPGDATD